MILIIHESWKSANPVYMCFVYGKDLHMPQFPQGIWQEVLWVCEARVPLDLWQCSNQPVKLLKLILDLSLV